MNQNIRLVESPVVVCGDIHVQSYDLLKLFKEAGGVDQNFVFIYGTKKKEGLVKDLT